MKSCEESIYKLELRRHVTTLETRNVTWNGCTNPNGEWGISQSCAGAGDVTRSMMIGNRAGGGVVCNG
jgi:hypothetical protein